MKYKDLIEKLMPFADEEINISVSSDHQPADPSDLENKNRITIDRVGFFRECEDNNFIIRIEQKYDSRTLKNIGKTKLLER